MKDRSSLVAELVLYAEKYLYLKKEDTTYITNLLLHRLNIPSPADETITECRTVTEIIEDILHYAVVDGLTTESEKTLLETELLGIVSPLPSEFIDIFNKTKNTKGSKAATDEFFAFCKNVNYIRTKDIAKNIKWETTGAKGDIHITINLSKPEKDPKDILKAKLEDKNSKKYPKCMLCKENVGFWGTYSLPARQTLRTVPITLNNEAWYMQYSPYMYFDNHCIAFSSEHRPMKVDINTYKAMLDFVDLFPHYFIGSNAALPIVGGSILSHDHYQGGAKVLPMLSRPDKACYVSKEYPNVKVSIADWYNSVIRMTSADRSELEKFAFTVNKTWYNYSDAEVGIIACDTEQHNAITPIATFENGQYTINFILRNNRTDENHPYGIFHPAESLHNIKKEGIGIIEVMGLFILPGRLQSEMLLIEKHLTKQKIIDLDALTENDAMYKHKEMIKELEYSCNGIFDSKAVKNKIDEYINNACQEILYTTGVFKNDEQGNAAFDRFMSNLGLTKIN